MKRKIFSKPKNKRETKTANCFICIKIVLNPDFLCHLHFHRSSEESPYFWNPCLMFSSSNSWSLFQSDLWYPSFLFGLAICLSPKRNNLHLVGLGREKTAVVDIKENNMFSQYSNFRIHWIRIQNLFKEKQLNFDITKSPSHPKKKQAIG